MVPINDVPHSGQWLDPSHNYHLLKQKNGYWRPCEPRVVKVAPVFEEMSLHCAFSQRWMAAQPPLHLRNKEDSLTVNPTKLSHMKLRSVGIVGDTSQEF